SERGRWAWDAIASKGRSPEPTRRDGIVTALRTNGRSRHERRSRRPTVDHGPFDVGAAESSSRLDGTRASLTLRAPRRSAWKALRGPAILSPSVPGAVADPSGRVDHRRGGRPIETRRTKMNRMQKRVLLLGSTGSIGESTLRVAEKDRKSTRLNSSHVKISYAVFCL